MSIKINGQEFLSYEEQVLKNKKDIEALAELLNTKVQVTFVATVTIEGETQIAKSSISTAQGTPKSGDLVVGMDGWLAKILSVGIDVIEISTSVPVLNYMNASNVAFDGINTEYLALETNVQAALVRLDGALMTINDDAVNHYMRTDNPHEVTKAQVGLGNVDNTSDADKPVSIAQAAALEAHENDVNNPHAVTKAQVGLGNVDNTSDADKPVSTAQAAVIQTIIDALASKEIVANKKSVINDSATEYPNSAIVKSELAKKVDKAQEAWITPTLLNGWTVPSGQTIQYRKDTFGRVWVRGRITGGTVGTKAFSVPSAYRPQFNTSFALDGAGIFASGYIDINGDFFISVGNLVNMGGISWTIS